MSSRMTFNPETIRTTPKGIKIIKQVNTQDELTQGNDRGSLTHTKKDSRNAKGSKLILKT